MRVFWISGAELQSLSLYQEEPFESWEWWAALGESWGGIACEKEGAIRAVWLLAERRVGAVRLWRMPLMVPYAPLLTAHAFSGRAYATRAEILRGLATFLRGAGWRFQFVGGALPPEWSYLPPFRQAGLYPGVTGSFVIDSFAPSSALRRKLRQAETIPIWSIDAREAFAFWQTYAPPGIHPKFRRQLGAMVQAPFPWKVVAAGDPPHAVGFFLWGRRRVWYYAGAHRPDSHPQAGTKLLATIIADALHQGKTFDFMGSILPGIERFFWQFGGSWEHRLCLVSPLLRRLSS